MTNFALALLAVSALLQGNFVDARFSKGHELGEYSYAQYLKESGKVYSEKRRDIFENNLKKIQAHNSSPKATYKMGVNQFTDQTEAEIKFSLGGDKHSLSKGKKRVAAAHASAEEIAALPASVDWREKGVVTAVKDQGHCGSCWAHAAVETIESFLAINTGNLNELSVQELVSCNGNPDSCGGTGGCEGSTAELAFDYLAEHGLPEVWVYGYSSESYFFSETNTNGACLRDMKYGDSPAMPRLATADGYTLLPRNNRDDLRVALATKGPVAVNVDASVWHSYEGGVFTGCDLNDVDINHVVQLVGYGTDEEAGDYWLVRNSWSPQWGEQGYIRLADTTVCGLDSHNQDGVGCDYDPVNVTTCGACGILYDSSYPTNADLYTA